MKNIRATTNRALLMILVIFLGVVMSFASEAGIEKEPFNKKGIQKRKNHTYSCKVLMEKHRSSSNIVVKTTARRPKWR